MSDHLSLTTLNALADGELATNDLASVTEHLHSCPACTSRALEQSLLKSVTARASLRYPLPNEVRERMERLVSSHNTSNGLPEQKTALLPPNRSTQWAGWAVAAALLVSAGGATLMEMKERRAQTFAVERAGLVTEISDQHIATLAANLPPQVLSSDRHTVKPWFQGKIPFSFNLPEGLPEDIKLEGANLAYLHNRPVAQLLYSIGKHHVSVFVQEKTGTESRPGMTEHSGFRLDAFQTKELDVVAISDVDPARLAGLVSLIQHAQSN